MREEKGRPLTNLEKFTYITIFILGIFCSYVVLMPIGIACGVILLFQKRKGVLTGMGVFLFILQIVVLFIYVDLQLTVVQMQGV